MGFAPTFYFGREMQSDTLGEKIREIAARAAEKWAVELVHCQMAGSKRNPTVRIFIDKPTGVTVEDCANVSRDMEISLDMEDLIPSSYVLEVSSPGIERGLFSLEDFRKFSGQNVRVKIKEPLDGQRNFTGKIVSIQAEQVVLKDNTRGEVRIPYADIAKANLVVDLASEFKRS